ncbi:MBL fold metallo-hydrolase [Halobaculum sp. MBLA0143]|uniref:MBL fold metallo-hydrolase n=1 Tax=Halobaculum sp. MBLA0143 TaxID=3079933 RepID=UPI0035249114
MKRIRLHNSEFEGENVVYVLDDGTETVLVDVGAAEEAVRSDLRAGLAEMDRELADVDAVLLTHWHYDHCGLAGEVQAASGATVYAHEADAGLIAGGEGSPFDDPDERDERLTGWGVPGDAREELSAFVDTHLDLAGESVDVTPLSDGEELTLAGVDLTAVHLPGHAAGLVGFTAANEDLNATLGDDTVETGGDGATAAFVGDAILPRYTPNVGGADLRLSEPLGQYVDSLLRLADLAPAVAYPGHRDPITDPRGRALEILEHHRDRTSRVVDVLAERGPSTPWAVSAALFGDLSEIHILHGPGEAYAHLAHLAAAGVVARDGDRYELAVDPETVAVADLFPTAD